MLGMASRCSLPLYKLLIASSRTKVSNVSLLTAKFHTSSNLWSQLVQFKLSDIGEGIREVTIKEWFVQPGDKVAQFDSICEVQSDKAAVTITSRYDGIIKKLHYQVDDIGHVGQPLVDIEMEDSFQTDGDDAELQDGEISSGASRLAEQTGANARALATPAVRRLAAEHGVSVHNVRGSGKQGRVLKEDVLAHISGQSAVGANTARTNEAAESQTAAPVAAPSALSQPQQQQHQTAATSSALLSDKRVPIKGVQKAMFDSMTQSARIPHFAYSDEIDMTQLMQMRQRLRSTAAANASGAPLSLLPFMLKAMSLALHDYPSLNAHLLENEMTLVHKAEHNIGIAVDSPVGLLVPCLHNVEQQSLLELATSLQQLIEAGRANRLTPQQLAGGTIALSNIGSIGGTYMKPVILSPQICIGAVGRVHRLPRYSPDGAVVPADVMQVAWSADHRVVDGATVARFCNRWKQLLENPEQFLLMMK